MKWVIIDQDLQMFAPKVNKYFPPTWKSGQGSERTLCESKIKQDNEEIFTPALHTLTLWGCALMASGLSKNQGHLRVKLAIGWWLIY